MAGPGQLSQRALDDPTVAAEVFTTLDAAAREPRCDGAGAALPQASTMVVALVGTQSVAFGLVEGLPTSKP